MFFDLTDSPFLNAWHQSMVIGAAIMVLVSILIYISYHVRLASITDYKAKHDFINTYEIRWFKLVYIAIGIAIGMIVNIYAAGKLHEIGTWFFVRLFIGIAAATLVGYISALVLEYYYPTRVHYKLRKWRYMP